MPIARSLGNSAVVAVLQTAGQLLLCSLAGYGLARIPYRHANTVFYAVLATLMIPPSVTFVPSFVVVSSLGWLSDFRGLVIPGLFSAFTRVPVPAVLPRLPARAGGGRAGSTGSATWGMFWRIVVPNSAGFFAAIAVISSSAAGTRSCGRW